MTSYEAQMLLISAGTGALAGVSWGAVLAGGAA
jgi:hypothetical protein